jgi:hypothetical protein
VSDNLNGEFLFTSDPEDIAAIETMRFDPSIGPWLMQAGLPTHLPKPFKTDSGEIITEIPFYHFLVMAARISQYKKRPWIADDIAKMKEIGLHQMEDRRVRHDAARRLREEVRPWRDRPGMAEHVRLWDEAIAVLRMPRGTLDNPHNWLRFSPQGKDMRPWVYMATEIAAFLVQILRGFKQDMPTFGEQSPIVVFTDKVIRFIGVNRTPDRKTLGNKLRETLAPLLTDWPPGN